LFVVYLAKVEKAIIVDHLVKNFEVTERKPGLIGAFENIVSPKKKIARALKDVSFTVAKGELVGFIGPNGAGKTTTLKILAGLLFPTAGVTQVLGFDPWERKTEFLKRISLVMGQKNQLWWDLPARESLALNAKIYGLSDPEFERILGELTEWLEVRDKLHVMVRELSLGERMKFELITALLHQPKVLFLDEPTIGLDVVSQKKIRDFLRQHNATRQTTILLTSHYMADIAELCQRVIIIDHGTIFFDGSLTEVLDRFVDFKLVTIQCAPASSPRPVDLARYGEVVQADSARIQLKVKRDRVIPVCKAVLDELPVTDMDIQEVPIEEVIRQIFTR